MLFSAAACFIGGLSNKACAEELRLRLQVIEENLSDTRATRDKLGRSAQKTANELRQIKQLRVDLAKSLYRYIAQANKLEARLRKLQEQELMWPGRGAEREYSIGLIFKLLLQSACSADHKSDFCILFLPAV